MKYQMVAGFVHFVKNMIFNKKLIPVNLINCDPPREKIIIQYGVEKSTYEHFVENQ